MAVIRYDQMIGLPYDSWNDWYRGLVRGAAVQYGDRQFLIEVAEWAAQGVERGKGYYLLRSEKPIRHPFGVKSRKSKSKVACVQSCFSIDE